jgi:thiol-disulfide isomerase/thioredoxin
MDYVLGLIIVLIVLIIFTLYYRWKPDNHTKITMLTPRELEGMINRANNTRRVTLHFTEWCGYCKQMKPIWDRVKQATIDSGIIFSEVDEDKVKTPGVDGYPTVLMLDEYGRRHKYEGPANFETLRSWVVSPSTTKVPT